MTQCKKKINPFPFPSLYPACSPRVVDDDDSDDYGGVDESYFTEMDRLLETEGLRDQDRGGAVAAAAAAAAAAAPAWAQGQAAPPPQGRLHHAQQHAQGQPLPPNPTQAALHAGSPQAPSPPQHHLHLPLQPLQPLQAWPASAAAAASPSSASQQGGLGSPAHALPLPLRPSPPSHPHLQPAPQRPTLQPLSVTHPDHDGAGGGAGGEGGGYWGAEGAGSPEGSVATVSTSPPGSYNGEARWVGEGGEHGMVTGMSEGGGAASGWYLPRWQEFRV